MFADIEFLTDFVVTDAQLANLRARRERTMARTHYHVMTGTVGCIPDDNQLFETKKAAEAYAIEEAAAYRDAGIKVSGSVKTVYSIDPINYLEVVTCNLDDCWDEHGELTYE